MKPRDKTMTDAESWTKRDETLLSPIRSALFGAVRLGVSLSLGLLLGLMSSGCSQGSETASDPTPQKAAQALRGSSTSSHTPYAHPEAPALPARLHLTIPWGGAGASDRGLGLEQPRGEGVPQGPSDLFATTGGGLLVLDRLNRRVVAVARDGSLHGVASVPRDGEHLQVGPSGSVSVWSRLRATIWFFEPDGAPSGSLAVPRALRGGRGFTVGTSRQVRLHTAFQSRFELGSPSAAWPLRATLAQAQEGLFPDEQGRGLAVSVSRGEVRLIRFTPRATSKSGRSPTKGQTKSQTQRPQESSGQREEDRATVLWRRDEGATAARLVGRREGVVCLKLERTHTVSKTHRVIVHREALCVEEATGGVVSREALPDPGLYLPRRELVLSTQPLRLVHMRPTASGLELQGFPVTVSTPSRPEEGRRP